SGRRYYSPSLGRFINRDPSEESGGLSLYAFCLNNPVNKWDYLGQDPAGMTWVDGYDAWCWRQQHGCDPWSETQRQAAAAAQFSALGQQMDAALNAMAQQNAADTAREADAKKAADAKANAEWKNAIVTGKLPGASSSTSAPSLTAGLVAGSIAMPRPFPLVIDGPSILGTTLAVLRTVFVGAADFLGGAAIFVFTPNSTGSGDFIEHFPSNGPPIDLGSMVDAADNQVKRLSPGEIGQLQDAGIDPHTLKPTQQGSRFDLFKDGKGNIEVRPKDGTGPGEKTGINIKNLPKAGGAHD
ncbi:MAG: polymorphic toxin type 33 domain-containing protein, partial [Terracidiphilus sp.]